MTTTPTALQVDGYRLAADRYYDEATHLWVALEATGHTRWGFDPLGSETSGDVVALAFDAIGSRVARGEAFGSLEAAKFVGPLTAPISGTIRAHNPVVLAHPGLVNDDPLSHWLVEVEPERPAEELPLLLRDAEAVRAWFQREVELFRRQGMVAE